MDTQLFLVQDENIEGLLAKSSGPQGSGPSGRLVFEGVLQRHAHLMIATYFGSSRMRPHSAQFEYQPDAWGVLLSGCMRRQAFRERSSFILRQLKQTTHVSCRHIYPSDLVLPLRCTRRQ
jgi:hypothetical protein